MSGSFLHHVRVRPTPGAIGPPQSGRGRYTASPVVNGPAGSPAPLDARRASAALVKTDELFRSICECLPTGIYLADTNGLRAYVNPRCQEIFGFTFEEALGEGWAQFVHEDDRERILREWAARFAASAAFSTEYRIRRPGGEVRWVWDRATNVFTADRTVFSYIGTVEDITDRKTAEQTLRRLSARNESTREEERARVARELHDELGQTLTSLRLDVAWLTQHLASSEPPLEVVNRLQSLVGQVELSIETVRRIAQGLRPATLDHHDLATAIRSETLAFQARTGIRCRFTSRVAVDRPDVERATAIFRILQEALTNVARHAQAGTVTVRLWEKARCVWLDVRDNGRGMTDAELSNECAVGLVGMRERAAGLGGEVRILSAPGKGTRVTIRIPAGPAAPRT